MSRSGETPGAAVPGAYLLAVRLDRPLALPVARLGRPILAPGLYLYAGSARGPGGTAARIARHRRRPKPAHWHIDHLTNAGRVLGAWAWPDGAECGIIRALAALGGVAAPVPGFGSSDCRVCPAHLLRCEGPFRSGPIDSCGGRRARPAPGLRAATGPARCPDGGGAAG